MVTFLQTETCVCISKALIYSILVIMLTLCCNIYRQSGWIFNLKEA